MPAKGNKGKKSGVDSDDDYDYKPASLSRFSKRLHGIDSFDDWIRALGDWSYGRGLACEAIHAQGCSDNSDDDPSPQDDDFDSKVRRELWTIITNSLSTSDRRKVAGFPKGRVERLIREIRKLYAQKSDTSLDHKRTKLESWKLGNSEDLDDYYAVQEQLHSDIEEYGPEEKISENLKRHYLFKGLPSEFDTAISVLKLPSSKHSWTETKDYLREYCATNKNCPGKPKHGKGKKSNHVYNAMDAPAGAKSEVCRNFTRGKCSRTNCKFQHPAELPNQKKTMKCFNCDKTGHMKRECTVPCKFCGLKGHGEKHCRKKKAAGKAYQQQMRSRDATTSSNKGEDKAQIEGKRTDGMTLVTVDDVEFTFYNSGASNACADGAADTSPGYEVFTP